MEENPIQLQVGVKCLLKNKEGKFLLLRRNLEKYKNVAGEWDIVGGRIDPGTPLIENLKREIFEETKLVFLDEPKLLAAQDIVRVPGKHIVRLTYAGMIDGEPEIDEENRGFGWFSVVEMKELGNKLDIFAKELLDKGFF